MSISGNDLDQDLPQLRDLETEKAVTTENFGFVTSGEAIKTEAEDGESQSSEAEVPCSLICGAAGTGKTYLIREKIANDPTEGILCATTGIAGVNLGTRTIHSILKYFNTDSLQQSYASGRLVRILTELACSYRGLYCDEGSMMSAPALDTIVRAMGEANQSAKVKRSGNPNGIGFTMIADFCQLPPIKEKWAFEAECWKENFEPNILRLTKNWRQGDGRFLDAINHLRRGEGAAGASLLRNIGVEFANANNLNFPGTTILAKNVDVDRYNWVALSRVQGELINVESDRWLWNDVNAPGEWKLIPEILQVKLGALVMILANDSPQFTYANGDQGTIESYDPTTRMFTIRLVRNNQLVCVPMIERRVAIDYDPRAVYDSGDSTTLIYSKRDIREGASRPWREPYFDEESNKYIAGGIQFSPIRLGYAATTFKTQGLSLDRVQIDVRNGFFSLAGMIYTAVSRCRTPEGIRIVGTPEMLGKRCKIDPKVVRFL